MPRLTLPPRPRLCFAALFALCFPVLLSRVDALRVVPPEPRGRGVAEEATPDALPASSPVGAEWRRRSQTLTRLGVDRWHAAGARGQGVKVAVLDSGFRGYKGYLGSVLPARVTARSFRADGNLEARDSQHGLLCAEVIHAVAPEAEILFANWESDDPETFIEAVRWARKQGARVLSCSLIMPSWSDGEGGGRVNAAVARVAGEGKSQGDMLCFGSAGNTAQRHWNGPFRPDAEGYHQWSPGVTVNTISPWGEERVAVELYTKGRAGYEVVVQEAVAGSVIGRATLRPEFGKPAEGGNAVVRFLPRGRQKYVVRVRCGEPEAQSSGFHLVALGGGLDYAMARGSIPCPADGPGFLAVGAVDGEGKRLFYSSCGPNSPRPKPDFVSEVPFPSLWRDRPFTGTSAAAPQVAGLAALWWSRHPGWTAEQVRAAMRTAAIDLGPPGHDWETGYGRATLP